MPEALGKAWGAVAADFDNDGRMDLFVSNDTVGDFLFMNRGGKFEETGLLANVGLQYRRLYPSGMGVDATDFDQDGWMDMFVANIDEELYLTLSKQPRRNVCGCCDPGGHRPCDSLDERLGIEIF